MNIPEVIKSNGLLKSLLNLSDISSKNLSNTYNNLLGVEREKDKIEQDISLIVKKIASDRYLLYNPKYASVFVKELSWYVAYLNSIIAKIKGKSGVEESTIRLLYQALQELRAAIGVIKNMPNLEETPVKKEIVALNEFINSKLRQIIGNEERIYRKKSPRTRLLMKFLGNVKIETDEYENVKELTAIDIDIYNAVKRASISEPSQKSINIGENAIRLLQDYRKKFEALFNVLLDIQEEEAKNLKLIRHYIKFIEILKQDRDLKELEELQKALIKAQAELSNSVRQDILYDTNLDKLLEDFKGRLEETHSKIINEIQNIQIENLTFLSGAFYYRLKEGKLPANGVIVVPGSSRVYKQYEPLIYRLVAEGFAVCAFDLPSQGSNGNWRIGLMSTYIYNCVRYLRERGIKKVGVVGHSVGAIAALYALGGYNAQLENYIIQEAAHYIESAKIYMDKDLSGTDKLIRYRDYPNRIYQLFNELLFDDKNYNLFKENILTALKSTRFDVSPGSYASIDVLVLLAPVESIQGAKTLPKICYSLPPRALQLALNTQMEVDKFVDWYLGRRPAVEFEHPSALGNLETLKLAAMEVKKSEFPDFVKYLNEVQNPFDFMSLLSFFSAKSDFVRAYVQRCIKSVPKMFLYGKLDPLLKPFIQKGTLERSYTTMIEPSLKNSQIKSYEGIAHLMMHWDWGLRKRSYIIKSPYILNDIVNFLKANIGTGAY